MYTLLIVGPLTETIYDLLNRSHSGCEPINCDGLRIHICLINDAKSSTLTQDGKLKLRRRANPIKYGEEKHKRDVTLN